MATQGTPLIEPFVLDEIEHISPVSFGDLVTPTDIGVPDRISAQFANRFPVPPTAWGFLTDPFMMLDMPILVDGVTSPYIFAGALYPESSFLEPTLGQIWPR